VDIITISPKGGGGAGLYEESYPGVPGITNESIPVENNSFSKTIDVSEDADAGRYVIWVSVPGRDGCYGNWNDVNNASELIKQIIDDYFGGDADGLRTKKQEQILAILEDATISKAGSDDLACIMELTVGHPSYNSFYKKIKVDTGADEGNYTVLVLSPGIDGVYGDSSYKYIDSILDLDGAGPELGVIDMSNKTQEEIVAIIESATINQAGSDDLLWEGYLMVYQPKIIYVDDDFKDDPANHRWNTIQEAINDANEGDTIVVRDGTYVENVDVNKRLTIRSENGSALTIVQAANSSDHVFEVTADYVNISGFTVKDAIANFKVGISLDSVGHCNISDNNASNNWYGISLYSSRNNIIADNNISNNTGCGIYLQNYSENNTIVNNIVSNNDDGIGLSFSRKNTITDNNELLNDDCGIRLYYSSNTTIMNNNASNNGVGIYSYSSSNNTLKHNTMSGNGCNFGICGYWLSDYLQNIDTSNKVNGKPIYYWTNEKDREIPSDAGYVGIVNSTNITVRNLNLENNFEGVMLAYTINSRIENVNASNNGDGICLVASSNNTITKNNVLENGKGINLRHSSSNTIKNNNAKNNYDGIWLGENSSNNTITNNNALNNDNGISLYYSSNNMIANNTAHNNYRGISLYHSSNNIITNNNASNNNCCGIWLYSVSHNIIYLNNFIELITFILTIQPIHGTPQKR